MTRMPTPTPPNLETVVRDALDARLPKESVASRREDLDAIERKIASRHRREAIHKPRLWILVPAVVVIGLVIFQLGRRPKEIARGDGLDRSPERLAAAQGLHIYIHSDGEPENKALRLDLDAIATPPHRDPGTK